MSDDSGREPLTMYMTGGPVTVPSTIRGVREALPESERAEFTAEIENVSADELQMTLMRWVMRIPTPHDEAEEALAERLAAGDLTGVTFADELGDDEYRSAP
ncbi:hypothetical protein ACIBCB_30995 [Streptomyces uncialis]|uniref:hypothetical protein n=1 Tax=Streptomyces uncialis TaxID=1048205 RepID=UPI002E2F1464|nr:hypothetical protein [Streptomyces uncialis]WTE12908.1 DUF3102 domain-containing protein [Streptomyces uncialis]